MATFDIRKELILRDVEWALSVGVTKCQRSAFGVQLKAAELYAYAVGDDGKKRRIPPREANDWSVMPVKRQYVDISYELELGDLSRIGKVQRWLRVLDAQDPRSCDVIMAMYSDSGAKWGRDAVLFQLTEAGQRIVTRCRGRGGFSLDMSDLEILANEMFDQERHPTKRRGREQDTMKTEASLMKAKAVRLLVKAATA